jgi:hypothetical protein
VPESTATSLKVEREAFLFSTKIILPKEYI